MKQIAPETLPARLYRDGEVYETERRTIFGRSWLLIAHESQFPNAGEYVPASEITTEEDRKICEAVQCNLNAGIYETGRLSPKHEIGVSWFQGEVKRALDL